MSLAIISHPDCILHDPGLGHPEQPARVQIIQEALRRYSFNEPATFHDAPCATREQLLLSHDPVYVDWIFSIAPKKGLVGIDNDTLMNPHTLTAALRAAGAALKGVDLLMKQQAQAVFCNVRPPGHHAEYEKAMGFCFFNNVAVAVAYAIATYQLERIAIIDFDVHHGNGTQNIFRGNKKVLYCSSFQHPFYPGYDEEMDSATMLTVALPVGTTGEIFQQKLAAAWFDQLEAFKPQLIVFSAGFDAHADDPLAGLCLHAADYVWLTQEIAKIAKRHCQGKMLSVLEGGYNLKVLAECVPVHVNAMLL